MAHRSTEAGAMLAGGTLALDLSSTVGFAYGRDGDRPTLFGDWVLPHIGGEGMRYAAFEDSLAAFIDQHAPASLVLEAPLPLPAQTAFRSAAQQFALRGIAFAEGWRASASVSEIDALTVRAEVMGQRRFSKDIVKREVVAYCRKRGIRVSSHHQADAVLVWIWHRQRIAGLAPCAGPLWRVAA
jgi:Holliday junction resolvasome RuvABC endonuclease subunit